MGIRIKIPKKNKHQTLGKAFVMLGLTINCIIPPYLEAASFTIPGFHGAVNLPTTAINNLPTAQGTSWTGVSSITTDNSKNSMVINQNASQAIIDWSSFNIGSAASVYFNQKKNGVAQTSWTALNLIHDANPSLIYGKLTADGTIYLINQNGILFGPGSQVNIHSMVASTLNLNQNNFLNGILDFKLDTSQPYNPDAVVSNFGTIRTDSGGSVFLIGPYVQNQGSIDSPAGQVGLVAGSDINLTSGVVTVNANPGLAVNGEGASITADMGLAGMYGKEVQQNGLIRSVTALRQNGTIVLKATDTIVTGPNSVTSSPIDTSQEALDVSFLYESAGQITFGGLNSANATLIEHAGQIVAPYGIVTMNATNRVFLDSGSSISVAGLWLNQPVGAAQVSAQLNSLNLRDDYVQKYGLLLGQTIYFNSITGSSIGDVSGSVATMTETAQERSLRGGQISLNASYSGNIIVKQGSTLDFSGGGINYDSGVVTSTKLLAGNKVYDISDADPLITYDKILGYQEVTYGNFGITKNYTGLYMGSGSPVTERVAGFTEGYDAGKLTLSAGQIVLNGVLKGSVERGVYQTLQSDPVDASGNVTATGLAEPLGGTLVVGMESITNNVASMTVNEIDVKSNVVPLPGSFNASDKLSGTTTYLSSSIINAAGLSSLSLAANNKIITDSDSRIVLRPGWGNAFNHDSNYTDLYSYSGFSATAGEIIVNGGIYVPGGIIDLETYTTTTSAGNDTLNQRTFLAAGSVLSAAGEQINNLTTGNPFGILFGHTDGGLVKIVDNPAITGNYVMSDNAQGVLTQKGSLIDVSGGYLENMGNVTGGSAGTVQLEGANLIISGQMKALSTAGEQGGTLLLHAKEVEVTESYSPGLQNDFQADSALPDALKTGLIISAAQLADTGFTNVTLKSRGSITVDPGVHITPSVNKLSVSGNTEQGAQDPITGLYYPDYLGTTSFSLEAGIELNGETYSPSTSNSIISISSGSSFTMAPGGSITMTAPTISLAGRLTVPGGTVSLLTNSNPNALGDLTLTSSASIFAGGYNEPAAKPVATNAPTGYTPVDAGTVTLAAGNGLIMEPGSHIDVSGSSPANEVILGYDGKIYTYLTASNPGSITLSSQQLAVLNGTLLAKGYVQGLQGGTLQLSTLSVVTEDVSTDTINQFLKSGFDDLTFRCWGALSLSGSGNVSIGNKLTLDAPVITIAKNDSINLSAPWIVLTNSYLPSTDPATYAEATTTIGGASLSLTADYLDVTGSVFLTGIKDTSLSVKHDLSLSDTFYSITDSNGIWAGDLETQGNLTLKADHIYPTTASNFTIRTGGKVTTLPADSPTQEAVYSAGGSLSIEALGGIEHNGVLAAPLGSITLTDTITRSTSTTVGNNGNGSRIFLSNGSVLTTAGDLPVMYGSLDNLAWTITDKSSNNSTTLESVTTAPAKSITISSGSEVITAPGSTINISGSGLVFAQQFLAGPAGTFNPLTLTGEYVIVPGMAANLPGKAVYLSGGGGVAKGVYTLLPEDYAYIPGAMIVYTNPGPISVVNGQLFTNEGYNVVQGYTTVAGTKIQPQVPQYFTVRSATDVLKEGQFDMLSFIGGNAGSVSIQAATTLMGGSVNSSPLSGYQGGSAYLSGTNITVSVDATALPGNLDFNTPLPASLVDTLQLAASTFSGKGLNLLSLGNLTSAKSVTVKQGVSLDIPSIILSALNTITIESGVQLKASSDGGTVSLTAPDGTVTIGQNAKLYGASALNISASTLNIAEADSIVAGNAFTLTGTNMSVSQMTGITDTVNLTGSLLKAISLFKNVTLASGSTLTFDTDATVSAVNSLTINAPLITGSANATFNAPHVSLLNSGTTYPLSKLVWTKTGGTLTINAGLISISSNYTFDSLLKSYLGNIDINGFSKVDLNSSGDLTLGGVGTLMTSADLNITAQRVTATYYSDATTPYKAANFTIDTTSGAGGNISISQPAAGNPYNAITTTTIPGGSLTFNGKTIDLAGGVIDAPAAQVTLNGDNGITLGSGSMISAAGYEYSSTIRAAVPSASTEPAGQVTLSSKNGALTIASGAVIDVSGVNDTTGDIFGDAGSITLSASNGGVNIAGTLQAAHNSSMAGGSFTLDTNSLDVVNGVNRLTVLNGILGAGGFNDNINIRARGGNLVVDTGQTITARQVTLTADGTDGTGNIFVNGVITVSEDSTGHGGNVELNAWNNLNVAGTINATGSVTGGNVVMSTSNGQLELSDDSKIDVSGGGTVYLRAPRITGNDGVDDGVKMSLGGKIIGASNISAEAVRIYNTLDTTTSGPMYTDAVNFMINSNVTTWLGSIANKYISPDGTSYFHILPGMEVQSQGDLTISSTLDLTGWRFGTGTAQEAGVLTLRAAGNLNIDADIIDHPTLIASLPGTSGQASTRINLIAGADLKSADTMAVVNSGSGTLTIKDSNQVYTESGAIRFASGGDTVVGSTTLGITTSYVINRLPSNIGTYSGSISGRVGGNLSIAAGGVIQSAIGDIDIAVASDLNLLHSDTDIGAIRTTGIAPDQSSASNYWQYAGGGTIHLDIDGSVNGGLANNQWDLVSSSRRGSYTTYNWSADYNSGGTEGIATMAGGSLIVRSGGDYYCQTGTFGAGDLDIRSGGDMKGRFLVHGGIGNNADGTVNLTSMGKAELHAMGNFGRPQIVDASGNVVASADEQVIEAFAANINVVAQGYVTLGTVLNPTVARNNMGNTAAANNNAWNLLYWQGSNDTPPTSVSLVSVNGNVSISGNTGFYSLSTDLVRILPPTLSIYAGNDIDLASALTLAPSLYSNLRLTAGRDINGPTTLPNPNSFLIMSDYDLASAYGVQHSSPESSIETSINAGTNGGGHSMVDRDNTTPIVITAGRDINDLALNLPKRAEINAGRDILDMCYVGQNLESSDITLIKAGREIVFTRTYPNPVLPSPYDTIFTGITIGGPGYLLVQAGGNIDLGSSIGIQAIGNAYNSQLGTDGATIMVLAGLTRDVNVNEVKTLFNGTKDAAGNTIIEGLRQYGIDYSTLQADGDLAGAQEKIVEARNNLIKPFFAGSPTTGGNIEMVNSQIDTTGANGNIYVLSNGTVDVGRSTLPSAEDKQRIKDAQALGLYLNSGIYTASGGSINIFAKNDVNVNQSRVMTFLGSDIPGGSDITIWSDEGNINAGVGSKTVISVSAPTIDPITGVEKFNPPSVGSGIRALTYDPNGIGGTEPAIGNVYLFAPQGVIDAGEAGISGRNVVLGATAVLNTQNISFSAGSIGVPLATGNTFNLGSLTGNNALTDTTQQVEKSMTYNNNTVGNQITSLQIIDNFMSYFLDVKVIEFDTETDSTVSDKQMEKDRKKHEKRNGK